MALEKEATLKVRRGGLLVFILMLPLIIALLGFANLQKGMPQWPSALAETQPRGAIIARDGTIFAEGRVESRRYPQGKLGAHVVGFSGALQPDGTYGLEGLERSLDALLESGQDVTMTLDPALQAVAQAELARAAESRNAWNGALIAIESGTGRILAAASYPEYDPNAFRSVENRETFANRAFLDQVEPGSTVKPLLVAALLQEGRLKPDEVLEADNVVRIGRHAIRNAVNHDPEVSVTDILRLSSNAGAITLGQRFTSEELYLWLRHWGFGSAPELAHATTRRGQVNPPERWVPQDHASTSIGYSMSVTALQLAAAYSVFANDGLYLPPRLLEETPAGPARRILSAEVARTVREMMVEVVESGEARRARVPGIAVAGKTGTGQIFIDGAYSRTAYTTSFAGLFPADDPKVTVVVYLQGAEGLPHELYGSTLAAPIFQAFASEAVTLWGLPPNPAGYAAQ
jgi:cell division protein FtsI (penicillin-binding protein 3)